MEAHLDALAAICRAALGPGEVTQLRQLSGGASMESWRFSHGDRDWVLRRLPLVSIRSRSGTALGHLFTVLAAAPRQLRDTSFQ